jgi:prepilin-type N-terminal cleavage/methylation domain-containing protein
VLRERHHGDHELEMTVRCALRKDARRSGFTLIELLVVVGIIVIATAMALPAMNQFLKGQKLTQGGRMIQSAFYEARQAAITQRSTQYIFMGHINGNGASGDIYALAHYRAGKGWDSTQIIKLPSSIQPLFNGDPLPPLPPTNSTDWTMGIQGCGLVLQDWTDGLPANNAPNCLPGTTSFMDQQALTALSGTTTFQFRKDGTISPYGPSAVDVPPALAPGGQTDIYDVNAVFDSLSASTKADIILRQVGEPTKLCFCDIDMNTGRVRFRVTEITNP